MLRKRHGGGVLLDMRAIEKATVTPQGDVLADVVIKPYGQCVDSLVVQTTKRDAMDFRTTLAQFKEQQMPKLSDTVVVTSTKGFSIQLVAQAVRAAWMFPSNTEGCCLFNFDDLHNGRTDNVMLRDEDAQRLQSWLNSHSSILAAEHQNGVSKWVKIEQKTESAEAESQFDDKRFDAVCEGVEQSVCTLLDTALSGQNLFRSRDFRRDFSKALVLGIASIAKVAARRECTVLANVIREEINGHPVEDGHDLHDGEGEIHIIGLGGEQVPEFIKQAIQRLRGGAPATDAPGAANGKLSVPALHCLQDVISHYQDFRKALIVMQSVAESTNDNDTRDYWKHQEETLGMMVAQAQTAINIHNEASK